MSDLLKNAKIGRVLKGLKFKSFIFFRVPESPPEWMRKKSAFFFLLDNDHLIQIIEARPALWDHIDRRHSDHHTTHLLWHKISEAIVPNWEDL